MQALSHCSVTGLMLKGATLLQLPHSKPLYQTEYFQQLQIQMLKICKYSVPCDASLKPLFRYRVDAVRSHSTPDSINWCVGYLLLPQLQNLSCLEFKSSGCHQSMFPDASICHSAHLSGSSRVRQACFVRMDFTAPWQSYRIYLSLLYCVNTFSRYRTILFTSEHQIGLTV